MPAPKDVPPLRKPGRPRKGEVRLETTDAERARRYQMRKRAEAKQDGRVEVLLFVPRQAADRLTELSIRRGCTRAEVVEKLILQADEFSRGE
ncbi:MAG: transcriptional regulator [Burkholderiales bacterium]|nr:transcriptional regulator [Burkholderiales bacterium]